MRKAVLIPLGALCLALAGYAAAQAVDGIDLGVLTGKAESEAVDQEALVREATRRAEVMRAEAQGVADAAQASTSAQLKQLRSGPAGQVDFDDVLRSAEAAQGETGRAPRLIVFASLSMPEASLKVLIRDTAMAGGALVFRGFPGNSVKAFQQGIARVVANDSDAGNIGVDPRLFRAFHVEAVPTFVAVSSDFDMCDGLDCTSEVPAFDRMSGNVTMRHVLETFAEGKGPGAGVASVALRRLEAGGT